jgi:hypothetical protein
MKKVLTIPIPKINVTIDIAKAPGRLSKAKYPRATTAKVASTIHALLTKSKSLEAKSLMAIVSAVRTVKMNQHWQFPGDLQIH